MIHKIVKQTKSRIYIECKPHKRTIQISNLGKFFLQMPYVYFRLHTRAGTVKEVYAAFNGTKVEKPKLWDMCYPPLPNCYDDLKVCMGAYYFKMTKEINKSPEDLAKLTVDNFFQSEFEAPYSWDVMQDYLRGFTQVNFYEKWAKLTRKNQCVPLIPCKLLF